MSAPALLADLRLRGLRVFVHGEKIKIHGPRAALTAETAAAIRAHKSELLMLIKAEMNPRSDAPENPMTPEIYRRAAIFQRQMVEWTSSGRWAVPVLAISEAPTIHPGLCVSCGTQIGSGWRCEMCLTAIYIALDMQGSETDWEGQPLRGLCGKHHPA